MSKWNYAGEKEDPEIGERNFTCTTDGHNKFWNVHWNWTGSVGKYHTVWGDIGSKGKKSPKEFSTKYQMDEWIDKKVNEKFRKGYTEREMKSSKHYKTPAELVKYYRTLCKGN